MHSLWITCGLPVDNSAPVDYLWITLEGAGGLEIFPTLHGNPLDTKKVAIWKKDNKCYNK